jgi:lysozyme
MSVKRWIAGISLSGLLAIAGFEGYNQFAYTPIPGDKLTIGFGHTANVKPGDVVDIKTALALLGNDVKEAEGAVKRCVKVDVSQNQFDALVSLTFNIGGAAFCNSTLLKCLNAGNMACVEKQWPRWCYSGGRKVKGLENRRLRELDIFRGENAHVVDSETVCFGAGHCISLAELAMERTAGFVESTCPDKGCLQQPGDRP